ncbi:MAG TPA: glycine--tRNA ligase [Candidatus Paceibacterota bacterium]|jgi:glycyl-tRNA synthetase|nr:glycine--tRNA ligase [Candidatus Paceibacterota bacterium]
MENVSMEQLISLCKRRGFIFQGSEIYGGLAGTWDYGPLGSELKRNIQNAWWKMFITGRDDMFGVDAAILMNQNVWKASGHVAGFSDPLVECTKCKRRFREDHLEDAKVCPDCGGELGEARQFNMMFKTTVGVLEDEDATAYLRPETAQGMFVNFKNVVDSMHPKLPFGLGQIGKAFRNEIAPRDFVFRSREFEQMEIEYFVKEEDWKGKFSDWIKAMYEWMDYVGIPREQVHELEVAPEDLAHYSKRTVDFEFDFPFGKKELYGLAYRTNFDLNNHAEASKVPLYVVDDETSEKIVPHCIEPTFGVDRTILAVLSSAYHEEGEGDDKRVVLKLKPSIAPYKLCVSPLLKNKPDLVEKARTLYSDLKKVFGNVTWDDNGNIGKRYRRQDEIGTPYCITVDFDTLEDDTVTVRDRDTATQDRVAIADLENFLKEKLQ